MTISKAVILVFFVFILFSLGSALYYLVADRSGSSDRIVKALTWRIGLSLLLFIFLFFAYAMGWIEPHSL